jgi:hypothetical protein
MHCGFRTLTLLAVLLGPALRARAEPHVDSWLTDRAGQYARVYTSDAARLSGTSVTTWSNGNQVQSVPAYCGVQEIATSADWVYLRTSGLAGHVMGPWYLNLARTQIFPNLPKNTKTWYRIPRQTANPATKTLTGLGTIGFFVDGVSMFDTRDGFYWNGSAETGGGGSGYWNRDAYVNEGTTFDPGYAHQENSGTHHYHANPIALRHRLGDHVDFHPATRTYSESAGAPTRHSPILGWVRDGHPIYGPYAHSDPQDPASPISRMRSGYALRNGQNGTDNLAATGRTTLPAWAQRAYNVGANQAGPTVNATYPLGRYLEDKAYRGDLGQTQGPAAQGGTFDLDEYNGRFAVTPEFPQGVYAYYVAIEADGTPAFPYNIGRTFRGTPSGGAVAALAEPVTLHFQAETNLATGVEAVVAGAGEVTLQWSGLEGGTYQVERSTNLVTWTVVSASGPLASPRGEVMDAEGASLDRAFYRVGRTALAGFDSAGLSAGGGGGNFALAPGGSAARGSTVTVTITLPTSPPQPPADRIPTSITLAGTIAGTQLGRPSQGTAVATFTLPADAPLGAQNLVVTFNPAPTYTLTGAFTLTAP